MKKVVENRDDGRRAAVTSTGRPGPGRWPLSAREDADEPQPGRHRHPSRSRNANPAVPRQKGLPAPASRQAPRNLPNRKGPGGTPAARRGGSQLSGWRRARPSGQQRAPSR